MKKAQIIEFLEENKWYPVVHPTDTEWETSQQLNVILGETQLEVDNDILDSKESILDYLRSCRLFPRNDSPEEEIEVSITLNQILSRIMWEIKKQYE